MNILQEHSLQDLNTFGIPATAAWYISYESKDELYKLLSDEYFQECKCIHIGEGSNLLFLTNFHGIVLKSFIKGISCINNSENEVLLRVGAGELWDDFVAYCVQNKYYGAENLSAIPGQVGAAAIQNIGAYGVEAEALIQEVEAIHRRTKESRVFTHKECHYAYRYSIFKDADYSDWIITSVTFKLKKTADLNISYAGIKEYLDKHNLPLDLDNLRKAIISIRASKLPDVKVLGNAGSFFKNPIVSEEVATNLLKQYPQMPVYSLGEGQKKLSAGWLIEQCGLKGYREGEAGVYEKQALILVNHGGATGSDIAALALKIQTQVKEKFDIKIEPEVLYIS